MGFRVAAEQEDELHTENIGHLELFRNFDQHGNRLSHMNTLLIELGNNPRILVKH